jgi:hypothetical protein
LDVLAGKVNMSVSAIHTNLKAVTATSPLQHEKSAALGA